MNEVEKLKAEIGNLRLELQIVTDLIDDVLYDPAFHPVDKDGKLIRGNDLYLIYHPVMKDHVPALREWFVRQYADS